MTQQASAHNQAQPQMQVPGSANAQCPDSVPQAEFIWKVHPYINEYIRFAETKSAAVIAWGAALISMLFSLKAHLRFMQGMVFSKVDWGETLLGAASLLAFLMLALAVGAAFWCVKPSLWSRDGSKTHDRGFIYWEQVRAHKSSGEFTDALSHQTPAQLTGHCAEHAFVLAGIAKRKYWWVDWSIRLAMLGSVFAGVVALFAS